MTLTPVNPSFKLAGTTGLAGYTLINGTGNIPGLSWSAPPDGNMHFAMLVGEIVVTTAMTGGGTQASFTPPSGGAQTLQMSGGGLAVGARAFSNTVLAVAPGTTVIIQQSAALTAGAAILFAGLWVA